MAETPETDRGMASTLGPSSATSEVKAWFVREVLPLEPLLIRLFRRSGRSDVEDLRQDVYMRVCDAAMEQIPHPTKPFVLAVARNLLIDRVRREHIVSIEAVENLDALNVATDDPGPDQNLMAREELRRLQLALEKLPRRLRAPVVMRKIEGLSRREIAQRLGVSEKTVEKQLTQGVRALADILYGESTEIGSKSCTRPGKIRPHAVSKKKPPNGLSSAAIARNGARPIKPPSMSGLPNRWRMPLRSGGSRPRGAGRIVSMRCARKPRRAYLRKCAAKFFPS